MYNADKLETELQQVRQKLLFESLTKDQYIHFTNIENKLLDKIEKIK